MKFYKLSSWLVIILIFGWTGVACAQGAKEVQGTISAIGKNYISVVYNRDTDKGVEYEMMLPFDENVEFAYKHNIKEFAIGDTVKIQFEDTTEGKGDMAVTKRKAKVISFVSPAPPAPPQSSLVSGQ